MKPAFARGVLPLMASTQLFRRALPSEPDGRGVPDDHMYRRFSTARSATAELPEGRPTPGI